MAEKKPDILFECSWEVCNKVGGIYTVITSKAAQILSHYKDSYYLIGPYFPSNIAGQFQECLPPGHIKKAFDHLKQQGILCHFGEWLIEGNPKVILLDLGNYGHKINEIKKNLWDWFKVDSLNSPPDYDEPVLWSYATGVLIEVLSNEFPGKKMVAQFHEWLSGAGLLYVKQSKAKVATVFTTHATVLGRSIANSEEDLYGMLKTIDPEESAQQHHVESKHSIEKAAANNADIFTTVSEITGIEAEHLLNKKPDVLLPNGLDMGKFPVFEDILLKHRIHRDQIRGFILSYFFPHYEFDIKQTLFFFLAGRYEFRAKGIDIYIDALGRLNRQLKEEKSKKTIVAFIWVPAQIRNIKPELVESSSFFKDIKDSLNESWDDIQKNMLYALIEKKHITHDVLFEKNFMNSIRRKVARFKKNGDPPIISHDLYDSNDIIINSLTKAGLQNKKEDKVKVVFYPIYLNGADGLLDLNYYEAIQGAHLGIFPSYYEPWGYTPLETGALGVPSVTTDLSGFGRYFCAECHQPDFPGIVVLKRFGKKDEEVTTQLHEFMHKFSNFSREERTKNKLEARKVAKEVDWKVLITHYFDAHNMALNNIKN